MQEYVSNRDVCTTGTITLNSRNLSYKASSLTFCDFVEFEEKLLNIKARHNVNNAKYQQMASRSVPTTLRTD